MSQSDRPRSDPEARIKHALPLDIMLGYVNLVLGAFALVWSVVSIILAFFWTALAVILAMISIFLVFCKGGSIAGLLDGEFVSPDDPLDLELEDLYRGKLRTPLSYVHNSCLARRPCRGVNPLIPPITTPEGR